MNTLVKKAPLEFLPEHLIQKILEFFQTKKTIKTDDKLTDYQFNQIIAKRRKLFGIKTDLKGILNLSMTNRYFNDLVKKSNVGKLILTIHYNSKEIEFASTLQHISYCPEFDCKNICHYVNKDIKHSNLTKKIALERFNEFKNNKNFKEDIVPLFKVFLTPKQIESYYRIKKMEEIKRIS